MRTGPLDLESHPLASLVAAGLLLAIGCFVVGSASPAAILAGLLGKDLRGSGSGNPGATNAGRVLGVRWGVLVGVLDVLKGFVPCWLLLHWAGALVAGVCGVFIVLGHIFSPFLKGRGGKGVATTLGVLLAVAPWVALVALVVFWLGAVLLRRVGEASVLACVAMVVVGVLEVTGVTAMGHTRHLGWVLVVLGLLVLARHKRNIQIAIARRTRGRSSGA